MYRFFNRPKQLSHLPRNYYFIFFGFLIGISTVYFALPFGPAVINVVRPARIDTVRANLSREILSELNLKPYNGSQVLEGNLLIIPEIGVQARILDNPTLDILDREEGVWRHPEADRPGEGGNAIIAGHRFQYLPPNTTTFYNLNQLIEGDKVLVVWEGNELLYEVYDKFEVTPDEIQALLPSDPDSEELTLYTCSPIGSNARRYVVKTRKILES